MQMATNSFVNVVKGELGYTIGEIIDSFNQFRNQYEGFLNKQGIEFSYDPSILLLCIMIFYSTTEKTCVSIFITTLTVA